MLSHFLYLSIVGSRTTSPLCSWKEQDMFSDNDCSNLLSSSYFHFVSTMISGEIFPYSALSFCRLSKASSTFLVRPFPLQLGADTLVLFGLRSKNFLTVVKELLKTLNWELFPPIYLWSLSLERRPHYMKNELWPTLHPALSPARSLSIYVSLGLKGCHRPRSNRWPMPLLKLILDLVSSSPVEQPYRMSTLLTKSDLGSAIKLVLTRLIRSHPSHRSNIWCQLVNPRASTLDTPSWRKPINILMLPSLDFSTFVREQKLRRHGSVPDCLRKFQTDSFWWASTANYLEWDNDGLVKRTYPKLNSICQFVITSSLNERSFIKSSF
ncbi:PREDICTED: uncharacterized protein LOC109128830 [Camelina sativa]|uniref:Uncharacterized protein LOC109128830 n=1 Tax=Camelina sativa TaxID=90675 RepID=A0ABM1QXJ0_CAMSA|nr:PREDICTED: uncharacterized protein LOC109128830 [Camelina sativa]XP_019091478.1 PREDICTED: uncharacterized protein LOC109128830 [Camelina sativa]